MALMLAAPPFASTDIMALTALAPVSTETRDYQLKDFRGISVSGSVRVVYTQDKAFSVSLSARADMLDRVDVSVKHGILTVKHRREAKPGNPRRNNRHDRNCDVVLRVSAPLLSAIALSGASLFETGQMTTHDLTATVSGASKFHADVLECSVLTLTLQGASTADVDVTVCTDCHVSAQGASHVKMSKVTGTGQARWAATGASHLDVMDAGHKSCDVSLTGASRGTVRLHSSRVAISAAGASRLAAHVHCSALTAQSSGTSSIDLSGKAGKVKTTLGSTSASISTRHLQRAD